MPRFLVAGLVCLVLALLAWGLQPAAPDLRIYCAHDALYAQPFLEAYAKERGLRIEVRYDTEATKSLGLTERILAEAEAPGCDLFWNNEPLGTMRLAAAGCLDPIPAAARERIPSRYQDPQGRWLGFGGRLRVWIINTEQMEASPAALAAALARPDLRDVALAKPLFGTTRAHLTALWGQRGAASAQAWLADLRERGVQVVAGNSTVKNLVAAGRCRLGLTDTDDYFLAVDAGAPVAMLPARLPGGQTLCLPNTMSLTRGAAARPAAVALLRYLGSAAAEQALAASRARQIPLGPVAAGQLTAEVRGLLPFAAESLPTQALEASREACLDWLSKEFRGR